MIHILDDREIVQNDLLAVRMWNKKYLGYPRNKALVDVLSETTPWCNVTAGSLDLDESYNLIVDKTKWDFVLGAVSADDLFLLKSIASFSHRTGIRSTYGCLEGLNAIVGPTVEPGQTACWNCCRLRQLANTNNPETMHALHTSLLKQSPKFRTHTYLAPMPSLLGHLLALEVLKLISKYTVSNLVGRILVQNLVTLETTLHTVIRMPWCEICGGSSSGPPQSTPNIVPLQNKENVPLQLANINNPEDLRAMFRGWIDNRTGVIKHLMINTPDATEPELPYTSSAVMASYTEGVYRPLGLEMGSGKGLSPTEAMIGAIGEGIERYSAARYRKKDLLRLSLNNLKEEYLDPRQLCLYEEDQYKEPQFPFTRFVPDQSIEWTKGHWLHDGKPVWLPALPTYYNFCTRPEERFCQVTSNGLAAGRSIEDASMRAVYELVERDAFMITWLCQIPAKRLSMDETSQSNVCEVIRQIEEQGVKIDLYLLDVGLSIPTVACIAFGDGKNWPGATVSLASHASPRTAVRKAILEQGHVGPYIRRLMLDKKQTIPAQPDEVKTLTDHALYYIPCDRASAFNFLWSKNEDPLPVSTLEEPKSLSFDSLVERITAAGMRIAIGNVTSPDVVHSPLRVVRALGINIQPIDFGFRLRRLANPRLKSMLTNGFNPFPHPLA